MKKMTLKGLRANYDLSAKEVAERLGIHHQTLLKYENDSTNIPVSLVAKLAKIYDVDSDFIFLEKNPNLTRIYTTTYKIRKGQQ